MKTAFVGAVEGSAIALEALAGAGLAPRLVVTLPPDAAHRHSDYVDLAPLARKCGSELLYTKDVNAPPVIEALLGAEMDLALVIGWSQICGPAFRSSARLGAVGFHPAPLPRMRGRAVIPWTILLAETTTAASLFWLDEGVDSGPLLLQETIEVAEDETARTLYLKQTAALARMLPEAVELVRTGNAPRIEQDHARATYCAKRTPEDGLIDWRQPAQSALRLIRAAGDPYPGAFTAYNAHKLVIDAAEPFAESRRFIGLPGQVVSDTPQGFVVRCGDGDCVHITSWRLDGAARKPRLHSKLGIHAP
ncbi:methionyl-tRNA formyltransferase [Nitratireductor luteus]|uniref:methionyl-tRNA formyltransferase n=1 Tax=Nitratireductor luteus TaxID=2976980 RepID=UPI002240BC97|nr:methionyl-tRNA formyltransferase [Nitratireductor luteus]